MNKNKAYEMDMLLTLLTNLLMLIGIAIQLIFPDTFIGALVVILVAIVGVGSVIRGYVWYVKDE